MECNRHLMSSHLPAGFRFHPTDQELISCYLSKKIASSLPREWDIIADIDLYKFNPWELPEKALFGEREWFFFSPRERKYPNGVRPNRAAASGYWKATGTDKPILVAGGTQCIGVKKGLVFHEGRPPKGTKTDWIMHEYRLLNPIASSDHSHKQKDSMRLDDWVLCRVSQKGNKPAGSDEAAETNSPPQSGITHCAQNEEKQKVVQERSSLIDWNDSQLLGCYLDNYGQEREWEVSDPTNFMMYAHLGGGPGYVEEQQQQLSPQLMPALLGSIKRKLSFGMLDELMLLPPGKRLQYSADGLLSPTESDSVNQGFPEFFISQY